MKAKGMRQTLKERLERLITSEFLQSLNGQKVGLCINKKPVKPTRVVESTSRKWMHIRLEEGVFTQFFVENGAFRNKKIRVLFSSVYTVG